MTNEEFERFKELLQAIQRQSNADHVDPENAATSAKLVAERQKLDRDMDRIERALKNLIDVPKKTKRQLEEDRRWQEFKKTCERRRSKIKEIGARTDAKIKALAAEIQGRNAQRS